MLPRAGDVVVISRLASVQFAEPLAFRVIRVHDWSTYDGWVWLDGYQLNTDGDAIERRSVFVQIDGLRVVKQAPTPSHRAGIPTSGVAVKPHRQGRTEPPS